MIVKISFYGGFETVRRRRSVHTEMKVKESGLLRDEIRARIEVDSLLFWEAVVSR